MRARMPCLVEESVSAIQPQPRSSITSDSGISKMRRAYVCDLGDKIESQDPSLVSTLDKLYVWEKKLYNEVKDEEKLRIMYERRCKKLKHLAHEGADADKIEAIFEMDYGQWLEEQKKQICEMRAALHDHRTDGEPRVLVETIMKHYFDLFRMKSKAARANVFYLMSGIWKSAAECFFFWIGGIRPFDLLKVTPQFLPKNNIDACNN